MNPKHSHIKSIMIDKAMEEINSIQNCLPSAKIQLCRVHVLRAFGRHIKKKLNYDALIEDETDDDDVLAIKAAAKDELWTFVHRTVGSKSEDEFNEVHAELEESHAAIATGFLSYFNKNWLKMKEMWTDFGRQRCFNAGEATNNRIESCNQKIKRFVPLYSPLDICYTKLMQYIDNRENELEFNLLQSVKAHFYSNIPVEFKNEFKLYHSESTQHFTEKISDQFAQLSKFEARIAQIANEVFAISTENSEYETTDCSCNCGFYTNTLVPCVHILFLRKYHCKKLYDKCLIPRRYDKALYHSLFMKSAYHNKYLVENRKCNLMKTFFKPISELVAMFPIDKYQKFNDKLVELLAEVKSVQTDSSLDDKSELKSENSSQVDEIKLQFKTIIDNVIPCQATPKGKRKRIKRKLNLDLDSETDASTKERNGLQK